MERIDRVRMMQACGKLTPLCDHSAANLNLRRDVKHQSQDESKSRSFRPRADLMCMQNRL